MMIKKDINIMMEFSRYLLLIAVAGVFVMFALMSGPFTRPANLLDILRSASAIGILGIGMTFIQATGEFDFSVGSLATLSAVCMAYMQKEILNNFWLAVIVTFAVCFGVAIVKIICVLYIEMPGWIATLGISTVLSGFSKYLTGGGNYFSTNWLPIFRFWGQGFLFGVIPMPAVVFIVVTIMSYLFLEKTKWGRHIYAVGLNPVAAEYVGINIRRTKALGFILISMCSCIAGIVLIAQLGVATPTLSDGNLLFAISTAMLGATFLRPGVFNIPGSFVGAIMLSIIANGLTMIGATWHMKDIVQGSVLVVSIGIVSFINMKSKGNN